jgi:hypothetical protein
LTNRYLDEQNTPQTGLKFCYSSINDAMSSKSIEFGRSSALIYTLVAHRPDDRLYLLMAPLNGAIALVQVYDVAVAVAEDLNFDVARSFDKLLEEQCAVAECRLRLGPRPLEGLRKFLLAKRTRFRSVSDTRGVCI